MSPEIRLAEKSRHAITDLYDEERRTFLIQYPIPFVVAVALVGVVVLATTGFLGYPHQDSIADTLFDQPWALYLWVCVLAWKCIRRALIHQRVTWARVVKRACVPHDSLLWITAPSMMRYNAGR